MRVWYRGFTIRSKKSFLENGKLNRFIVARLAENIDKHENSRGKKVKEMMGRGK
jgi:hypothetical protein